MEFASNGSKGSCLMLNDDGLERYSKADRLKYQQEMVSDCLNIAISDCKDFNNEIIQNYIVKSINLLTP